MINPHEIHTTARGPSGRRHLADLPGAEAPGFARAGLQPARHGWIIHVAWRSDAISHARERAASMCRLSTANGLIRETRQLPDAHFQQRSIADLLELKARPRNAQAFRPGLGGRKIAA